MVVLRKILKQAGRAAFLVGNGPNLHAKTLPCWNDLLKQVPDNPLDISLDGVTNTEKYDIIEMNSHSIGEMKKKVAQLLELNDTSKLAVHKRILDISIQDDLPVLTTNFDRCFEEAINAKIFRTSSEGFTRFYPWKTYYGLKQHLDPTKGFGIWKVNGDVNYPDSIRLGLTDYVGSIERARKLIHNGDEKLFEGKRQEVWQGFQTWLHIWFNMPMIIFGFGCGPEEVFIRWLLIERKRYLNIYDEAMNVWFINKGELQPSVGNLLQNLGVNIVIVNTYDEIYGRSLNKL
jgi:hypothetical protein